jgi:hypothetical protein
MGPPVYGSLSLDGAHEILPPDSLDISDAQEQVVARCIPGAYRPDGGLSEHTLRSAVEMAAKHNTAPSGPSLDEVVDVSDESVVWGGNIVGGYGNFLTESVSRLWPLLPGGRLEGSRVVFTTPRSPTFATVWLTAFGTRTVELPEQGAIRFRRTRIPEPAWQIGNWIAPEFRDVHLHARRGLEVPTTPRHDLLWLSRWKLDRDSVPYDEALFEWLLGSHATPVHLEAMTLGEQVGVLERSRAIAGIAGGAFHTLLLTVKPPDCLYLSAAMDRSIYTGPQLLIGANATFALALFNTMRMRRARESGRLFPGSYRVHIPAALRAFEASILPDLNDDRRLAVFAEADRDAGAPNAETIGDELDTAVMRVLRDPFSFDDRMALAAIFEDRNLTRCAAEQYVMVAELSERQGERARPAALRALERARNDPPARFSA